MTEATAHAWTATTTIAERTKRVVFFTMILHPVKGWIRVGEAYATKQAAAEWLPFVRGSWRGLRGKVSACTLYLDNGRLSEKSKHILDVKYNLDMPAEKGPADGK